MCLTHGEHQSKTSCHLRIKRTEDAKPPESLLTQPLGWGEGVLSSP